MFKIRKDTRPLQNQQIDDCTILLYFSDNILYILNLQAYYPNLLPHNNNMYVHLETNQSILQTSFQEDQH